MIEEFLRRGLHRTVDFLAKIGHREDAADLSLSHEECVALARFGLKEYAAVYAGLRCSHFLDDALVFCACFKPSLIFLRNRALLVKSPAIDRAKSYVQEKDEFLLFLEALVHKNDQELLRAAVRRNELFWEAYELLDSAVEAKTAAGRKVRNAFLMFLASSKHRKVDYEVDFANLNLAAAAFYSAKDYARSEELFERVVGDAVFDLDHIDLYSNILYLNKDPKLGLLAQRALRINAFRPETYIAVGNYYSLKGDHARAIENFLKAIELDPRYAISYTLVGHEYMEMKNVMNAIKFYTESIKANGDDYRAWFGIAQAYSSLKMYEYSLIFFKKSVEMRPEDGFLWLTMGQVYARLRREEALKCFSKAIAQSEVEALLHAADFYKTLKKYTEAVKYYERYVDKRGKDLKRISAFLGEYFTKVGNKKKAEHYGLLA